MTLPSTSLSAADLVADCRCTLLRGHFTSLNIMGSVVSSSQCTSLSHQDVYATRDTLISFSLVDPSQRLHLYECLASAKHASWRYTLTKRDGKSVDNAVVVTRSTVCSPHLPHIVAHQIRSCLRSTSLERPPRFQELNPLCIPDTFTTWDTAFAIRTHFVYFSSPYVTPYTTGRQAKGCDRRPRPASFGPSSRNTLRMFVCCASTMHVQSRVYSG